LALAAARFDESQGCRYGNHESNDALEVRPHAELRDQPGTQKKKTPELLRPASGVVENVILQTPGMKKYKGVTV